MAQSARRGLSTPLAASHSSRHLRRVVHEVNVERFVDSFLDVGTPQEIVSQVLLSAKLLHGCVTRSRVDVLTLAERMISQAILIKGNRLLL